MIDNIHQHNVQIVVAMCLPYIISVHFYEKGNTG